MLRALPMTVRVTFCLEFFVKYMLHKTKWHIFSNLLIRITFFDDFHENRLHVTFLSTIISIVHLVIQKRSPAAPSPPHSPPHKASGTCIFEHCRPLALFGGEWGGRRSRMKSMKIIKTICVLGCEIMFVTLHFVDLFDFFEFLKDMKIKRNVCHFVLGSMFEFSWQ